MTGICVLFKREKREKEGEKVRERERGGGEPDYCVFQRDCYMCCIIGHFLDQKRLKQGLYRHPWDDISYIMPETMGLMGEDTDKI